MERKTPANHGVIMLFPICYLFVIGELLNTVVLYVQTVYVCVVDGGEGDPLSRCLEQSKIGNCVRGRAAAPGPFWAKPTRIIILGAA